MDKRREAQIQKHFGERVRELRKQKGLSQESLALACDLDRTYIGGVERGERNISLINIHKIARAIGVPPSELFTDAERKR
jgi:transcriptional regulator with XRE-family HTH domain